MERPFAYNGVEPYIFVSYSHRNCDRVWPIIERLEKDGYRVWYDDGISPGTEWDVNIADHITHCGYFFALITKEYLKSDNCRDELNFVRELKKTLLLVYLEDIELPAEMKMRLGRLQAVQWFAYADEESAYAKLYSTAGLDVCRKVPEKEDGEEGGYEKGSAGSGTARPQMKKTGRYMPEKAEESRPKDFTPEKVRDDRPEGYTPEKAEETAAKYIPEQSAAAEDAAETADRMPEQESLLSVSVSPAGVDLVPGRAYEKTEEQDAGNREEADGEWTVENKAGEILGGSGFSNQSDPVSEADLAGLSPDPVKESGLSGKNEEKTGFVKKTENEKKQPDRKKKKNGKLVFLLALLAIVISAAWSVISSMGSKGTLNDFRYIYGVALDMDAKGYLNSQKYQMLDYNGMECEVSVMPYRIHIGTDPSKTVTLTFLDRYGEEFSFYGTAGLRRGTLNISAGGKEENVYGTEEAAPLKTSLKYTVSPSGGRYTLTGYGKTEYYSWKSRADGYFDVEGYLSENTEAYKDLAGLRLKCDPDSGRPEDVQILFTNGGHAEEITVKGTDTDTGRIELEWKKVVRPYNGRIETDEVNGYAAIYISDQYPYGFSVRSGEDRYFYLDKIPEDLDPGEPATE